MTERPETIVCTCEGSRIGYHRALAIGAGLRFTVAPARLQLVRELPGRNGSPVTPATLESPEN